ncbi:MAG TPA: CmcJ/NvfI family oxidoreductase [Stellaceae bacterium]|nr:CmcJ/NvfI family oxidoreductase [Stellaceae bacterium]
MDGMAQQRLKGVVAPVNFMLPMAEKPYSYNYDPPPGVAPRNTENVEHGITVHDARAVEAGLSLDREGFVLVHHKTAASDLYDEKIITQIYYPECERLMKEATGAAKVVAFDHIVRNAAKATLPGSGVKMPAGRVHNDYTAWSAPQRVRDLMGDEATELLKHRFAISNVWRPIAGPLLRSPLALCDAASLDYDNLVASDLRYPDRTGETYAVTYSPNQRWYYFPKMQPDEAVLIRCYDSARHGAARFSAHGAFDDPQTPADAPPRESIEVRTLVFF